MDRSTRTVLRLSRRRRQRGAAMVEAAFMLPMFVILWYGSLYVHNLGSNYIKVNTAVRQTTWQTAMANCGIHHDSESERLPQSELPAKNLPNAGGTASIGQVGSALGNGNVVGAISSFVSAFTSIIASIFPNPEGAIGNQSVTVHWRVPDLYDHSGGEQTTTVKGTNTVVCNEAPMNGSISNVGSGIVSIVESIVHLFG